MRLRGYDFQRHPPAVHVAVIDEACRPLPRDWETVAIPLFVSKLKKPGAYPMYAADGRVMWLHKRSSGLLWLTTDRDAQYEAAKSDYSWGPDLWDCIHRSAWHLEGEGEIEMFLLLVDLALPCGKCTAHWRQLMQEMPVDYAMYFESTWAWHNTVSRSIDPPKPEMGLEEARALYAHSGNAESIIST